MEVEYFAHVHLKTRTKDKTEKNKKNYEERLKRFLVFLSSRKVSCISELSLELVSAYETHLKETLSPNTRYMYLSSLKWFLSDLYEEGYLFLKLADRMELPKWERKTKPVFSYNRSLRLIEKSDLEEPFKARSQAVLALYLLDGLKSSDIADLSTLDLEISHSELRLKRNKTFLSLHKRTLFYLKRYIKQRPQFEPKSDWLFVSINKGRQLEQQSIRKIIKEGVRL